MQKRVLVALKMSCIAGQKKLSGVFRYLRERYGDRHPWEIRLVRNRTDLTPDTLKQALADGTDGFIVSIPDTERSVLPLAQTCKPTVIMDIHSPAMEKRRESIVFIRNSGEAIGRRAAEFLVSRGIARSYAFLHSDPVTDWSRARFKAFKDTLNEAGLWCEEFSDPLSAVRLKRPAAVFAANDDRAFDLIKTLASKRMKIPHHVAVLGTDNDTLICENSNPRISSVEPDFEEEGRLAAEYLDAMMAGKRITARTIHVGVKEIVRRESTTEESNAGKLVQKAVAYIDRHALDGITVRDVVKHLRCSRRLADLRFRELQGRSILDAITERRLDEVKRRLAGTKEKTDFIAVSCGYRNPNYLKNLFKKRFGMSMREFRRSASVACPKPSPAPSHGFQGPVVSPHLSLRQHPLRAGTATILPSTSRYTDSPPRSVVL